MENKNLYAEEKFCSFINKTIALSSKSYFKKQMRIVNKEKVIVDDEDYRSFLQNFAVVNNVFSEIEDSEQLNNAVKSLSAIEQSVIFLLFKEELSQDEAAQILEICTKSVSRIKLRAIDKLKKHLKGVDYDE